MYQVSRKTYVAVRTLIEKEDDSLDKAEEICELIENEINNSNQTFEKKITPTKEFAGMEVNLGMPSVDNETQIEAFPSWETHQETKEEKMARIKEMVRQWRGQLDKNGNFVPTVRAKNLLQDAKDRE